MIIGICGLAGSGKDTTANIIQKYDSSFEKISFARKVKDITALSFGWDRKMLDGDTIESRAWREKEDPFWKITPRKALQKIGTDCFRNNIDNNFWVKSLEKNIKENSNQNYIITDIRFPNELKMIQSYNGVILRIKRTNNPEWWDIAITANGFGDSEKKNDCLEIMNTQYKNIHISEWGLAGYPCDYIIENFSSLKNLEHTIIKILNEVKELSKKDTSLPLFNYVSKTNQKNK